jgi:hypothetical protein
MDKERKNKAKQPKTATSSDHATTVADHEARIARLERHVTSLTALAAPQGGVAGATVTVAFDLDEKGNTAKFARLYFPGHDEDLVNNLDSKHAVLKDQPLGSTIQLIMEVRGDPGQVGSFLLKGATPTPLKLRVQDGPKSPKLLFVSG